MHTEISDRKPSTALMDTAEYNLRLQVPYSTSTNGSRQTVPIIPPPRPVRERPAQTSKTLPLSFQSLASVTSVLRHPTTMYMYACYGFLAPAAAFSQAIERGNYYTLQKPKDRLLSPEPMQQQGNDIRSFHRGSESLDKGCTRNSSLYCGLFFPRTHMTFVMLCRWQSVFGKATVRSIIMMIFVLYVLTPTDSGQTNIYKIPIYGMSKSQKPPERGRHKTIATVLI
ncbi:unnamed protein product [Fusarium graminearum]|uniref:Chromosome 1, complete genome n=1 Tax=Gibberella zeae (strain ATCC MYA-4620 / CBS 123657 / FGSC 9075 / NRRL 31084 / PH-1) TaxID=229533 RepID=I1SA26_GIBZE|nr:hypothetical protein FGSG_13707 [Fusarium graminearum PH-1]ESU16809.1 hypothetical protein FGSG_13707 [Fusarium graminearum PH-1]CEF75486.1 unnamed protein product [Fusarium graminearum]CZS78765.1 unnamed protein product [Fusarium graminearum]|eukprot:XP_011319071.1 hypothetical protein FGSG_13707 [Fusarium graminearum PH-1]